MEVNRHGGYGHKILYNRRPKCLNFKFTWVNEDSDCCLGIRTACRNSEIIWGMNSQNCHLNHGEQWKNEKDIRKCCG